MWVGRNKAPTEVSLNITENAGTEDQGPVTKVRWPRLAALVSSGVIPISQKLLFESRALPTPHVGKREVGGGTDTRDRSSPTEVPRLMPRPWCLALLRFKHIHTWLEVTNVWSERLLNSWRPRCHYVPQTMAVFSDSNTEGGRWKVSLDGWKDWDRLSLLLWFSRTLSKVSTDVTTQKTSPQVHHFLRWHWVMLEWPPLMSVHKIRKYYKLVKPHSAEDVTIAGKIGQGWVILESVYIWGMLLRKHGFTLLSHYLCPSVESCG